MQGDELIMELTQEQGGGRETQVQPPVDVWVRYFGFDFGGPMTLQLRNRSAAWAAPEARPIVEHDHNWTVEIIGAELPRPATLRMRRTGPDTYDYWVYRPEDDEFYHCEWMLETIPNPHWKRGRRWLII